MSRWVLSVVLVVLAVAAAIVGWRAYELDEELDSARDVVRADEQKLESMAESLEQTEDQLNLAKAELKGAQGRARNASRLLKRTQPCGDHHFAHVWLFPSSGSVGTRVRFVGDCFVDSFNDTEREIRGGYGMFLIRQLAETPGFKECEQIVGVSPFDVEIRNGRAAGYFTVGHEGSCFQHQDGPQPVVPGVYELGIACHACSTNARFRVTP